MNQECIFCKIIKRDIKSEVIYESDSIIAFLDIDPINEGHILVIPKQHYLDLDEIPDDIVNEIFLLSKNIVKVIKQLYNPEGYSIMQNGGQFNDIGHYHLHIFPRYENDGFGWTFSDKVFDSSSNVSNVIKEKLKEMIH